PDLEYINRAAYWDYQREKVYVRSSPQLKRISRRISHTHTKTSPVNKIVEYDLPSLGYCPKCKVKKLARYGKRSKVVHDLRFDKTGIKRWIVKYVFQNYFCRQCGTTYYSQQRPWTRSKFGPNLQSYAVYQIIELRLPRQTIAHNLVQLFNFSIEQSAVTKQKSKAAQLY